MSQSPKGVVHLQQHFTLKGKTTKPTVFNIPEPGQHRKNNLLDQISVLQREDIEHLSILLAQGHHERKQSLRQGAGPHKEKDIAASISFHGCMLLSSRLA